MRSKWIVIGIIVIVILLSGAFLFLKTSKFTSTSPSQTAQSTNETQVTVTTSPTGSTDKTAKIVEVSLTSEGFSPSTITIDTGTKIVWTNKSGKNATVDSDPHPIHTSYTPLNLGNFGDGDQLEFVFNESGTYNYHNHLKPSNKGAVIVK